MATISNTIALNDAMSPTLRSIAAALASVNAAFEQVAAISGGAFDTQNIREANRALEQTEQAQDDVTESIRESSAAADGLWGKIKGAIAAYAGWQVVSQTVAWSDEMTNIQARLDAANDGTQSTAQYMKDIYRAAQASHAPFQQTADLVGKLRNNAAEAFQSNAEAVAFAEQLNKQFAIAGASQQGASDATFQLIQALGSGALRGEELNSILDQAPNIVRTIADHMGVPIGQIRQLASEGKITADVVKNAILGAADKTNAAFEAMPLTFASAWEMAKNTFQMQMLGLQQVISQMINTQQFQEIMNGLTAAISTLAALAIPIIKSIAATVGFLYRNWDLLAPVIYTVTGAILAYKAAMAVATMWAMRHLIVEKAGLAIKVVAASAQLAWATITGTATAATAAQTAAQWGLNAAMLANPVGLIIAAVVALIGLLYLTVAMINKVTGSNYSATGLIAGYIWGLWAFVKNIVATVWNVLVTLAEFFYNVWTNPVYSIKKLLFGLLEAFAGLYLGILKGLDKVLTAIVNGFYSALNVVIDAMNWTINQINRIPGVSIPVIARLSYSGTVATNAEKEVNAMLGALNPGAAPDGYKSFDGAKMDYADPAKYAAAGYEAGAKFSDDPMGAIKGALGLADDPAIQQIMDAQQQGNKTSEQIAKNTGKEDDYKYLKEIMAGRAVDRLSGTDIRIQMNNNNKINSGLDLDSIVNELARKLTGAMNSAAEGVHP